MSTRKLLYTREEACDMLSVKMTHFETKIQPHLRIVRSGRLRLVPASELDRWVNEQARFPG